METLVSITHHAYAFIDKILKKIVQIFEWLGKLVTNFYMDYLLSMRDLIFKAKRITTNKTVHETPQTEQYRQNSSLPETSMTTSVIQTDKIHESTLVVRLAARNADSSLPTYITSSLHCLRFCFAVSLSRARPIESCCS